MNRKPLNNDASWENDAVWKLLDQAPPATAGPRFADDVVRAARLIEQPQSWWRRIFSPAPLAGLAAATAALAFAVVQLTSSAPGGDSRPSVNLVNSEQAAEIQEIAETETLLTAVDHLDDFSDTELASLIGF
ncbi:MAG: hypothetical protein WCS43_00600 [Verrucomicrobiota bacterium]